MSELMRQIPFKNLVEWSFKEYKENGSIFGIRKEKFYTNESGTYITMFGDKLSSPIGPAAGPNSQLTQNILTSYLGGSRFIELKTVQKMDGEELRSCISRPCINAEDECYNVEWSTELTVEEAFNEYVKAWFLLQIISKELGISNTRDFAFNMSVGYDLEGIKTEKIDNYIEGMKDASKTEIWNECIDYLKGNLSKFKNIDENFVDNISSRVCSSITLSTLHGCPPDEIDRIARYLLSVKKVHTYIKCNPTLLGYDYARKTMDKMGYSYLSFDDHHFKADLQYNDAVKMLYELMGYANEQELDFGVKITNTFPVQIKNNELPGEEMYMSGRSLFPLSLSVACKLAKDFDGKLPISFSGGADFFNIESLFQLGIRPITVATTILKPGGYERLKQLADVLSPFLYSDFKVIDVPAISKMTENVVYNEKHLKKARTVGSRKTKSELPLFDCFKAPCKDGGCPIEQQIPEYLKLVSEEKYDEAFKIISIDNANPGITGSICNHNCQTKCTRLDYDASLRIRNAKNLAVQKAQNKFIENIKTSPIKTDKKVAIIGAGPAGVSTALFLRRNGVHATVLEKRAKSFGIVSYVIPEFRIPMEMIEKDYNLAVKTGVEFKFNVDEQYSVENLKKEYDFVVLATGAWLEGVSPIKEGKERLIDALKFLEDSKTSNCKIQIGQKIAVIGGGDVAMDCARAAKRAPNVTSVSIVYRRTKDFMPAEHEEIELAENDGVEFIELLSPTSYDGKILTCEKMMLGEKDASGRRGVQGTGEIINLEYDTVISAVGARVDHSIFIKNGVKVSDKGKVEVSKTNETSVSGVYMAGDCKFGASTIVNAIADGKKIAKDILAKLNMDHDFNRIEVTQQQSILYLKKGVLSESVTDNNDGYRCLACDQICEICCDVCPNRANIAINVDYNFQNQHQILHVDGMCNECGNCGVFCPHTGNPYKDKITLYWTEHDFIESTNKGFLPLSEGTFKIRLENNSVVEYKIGEKSPSTEITSVIEAVIKNYSYLLLRV